MRSLVSAKDTNKIFFKRLSLVCLNFSHDVVDQTVTPNFVIRTEVFKTALLIMKAGKEREITRVTRKKQKTLTRGIMDLFDHCVNVSHIVVTVCNNHSIDYEDFVYPLGLAL